MSQERMTTEQERDLVIELASDGHPVTSRFRPEHYGVSDSVRAVLEATKPEEPAVEAAEIEHDPWQGPAY